MSAKGESGSIRRDIVAHQDVATRDENSRVSELQDQMGVVRIKMEMFHLDLNTRLSRLERDSTKSIKMMEATLDLVRQEIAEMRQSFELVPPDLDFESTVNEKFSKTDARLVQLERAIVTDFTTESQLLRTGKETDASAVPLGNVDVGNVDINGVCGNDEADNKEASDLTVLQDEIRHMESRFQEILSKDASLHGPIHNLKEVDKEEAIQTRREEEEARKRQQEEQETEIPKRQYHLGEGPEEPGSLQFAAGTGEIEPAQDSQCRISSSRDSVRALQNELKCKYSLQESAWDASVLIGIQTLSYTTSAWLVTVVLLNFAVQAVFCGIVWVAFDRPDFDEEVISSLKVWRRMAAHDASNVNDFWPYSLGARICENDQSLQLSAQQANHFDSIEKFQHSQFNNLGWLMCVLCLLCLWTLLWSDFRDSVKYARSMVRLHHSGARTKFVRVDEGFRLESISRLRLVFVLVVIIAKVFVVADLFVVGTRWLAWETNVGDLLLNAVALEMILNVDELLFMGLAPAASRVLIGKIKPLEIRRFNQGSTGMHFGTIGALIWLFALLPLVSFTVVSNTDSWVSRARNEICGGVTNFVHAVDPLGIVYIHDKMSSPENTKIDETNPRVLALNEVIHGIPSEEWQYAVHVSDLRSLKLKSAMPYAQLSYEINPSCEDLLVAVPVADRWRPHLNALRHAADDMSIDSCSVVESYCYGQSEAAGLARMLCPVSCGCRSPLGGTMLRGWASINGCPHACEAQLLNRASRMRTCPKEAELSSPEVWQIWMEELRAHFPQDLHWMITFLENTGCQGLLVYQNRQDMCNAVGIFDALKPLAPVCPAACGCNLVNGTVGTRGRNIENCPLACFNQDASVEGFCSSVSCDHLGPGMYLEFEDRCECPNRTSLT